MTNEFQTLKKKSDDLLRILKEKDFKVVMENVSSPLDPTLRFRDLKSVYILYLCVHSAALNNVVVMISCPVMTSVE